MKDYGFAKTFETNMPDDGTPDGLLKAEVVN